MDPSFDVTYIHAMKYALPAHSKVLSATLAVLALWWACGAPSGNSADEMPPGDWIGRCKKGAEGVAGPIASAVPEKWVDDQALVLSSTLESELHKTLAALHGETCHQVGIVTVASLKGRPIEDYSLSYAKAVGFGYQRFNNGVLLLVAPNDRKVRIEVGCGLEDVVSDHQAAEIIRNLMVPTFRTGDVEGGIRAGVSALIPLVKRKMIPDRFRPHECRK